MTELFGRETGDCRQGYLFTGTERGVTTMTTDADPKRRPGESALDYRIRRQYRDVAATAPLFPVDRGQRIRG
jgi:hypothetical protein